MAIAFDSVRQTYDGLELSRGRVKIIPADQVGKDEPKLVQFTRCTTFIDVLTSAFALMKWEQRKMLAGLVQRPDLLVSAGAFLDDVVALDETIEKAKAAGKADEASGLGTAMHRIYERLDRGEPLVDVLASLPTAMHDDVYARQALVEGVRWNMIEGRVVIDTLKVTGTPDRVGTFPARHPRFKGLVFPDGRPISGKSVVVDDKGGKIEDYNILKVAMQLAIYARSWAYDKKTGKRTPHGADTMWGLILHTPTGSGRTEALWVDLTKGWQAVMLCKAVREARNLKVKQLCHAFEPPAIESSPAPQPANTPWSVKDELHSATTVEELFGIYELHKAEWTDEFGQLATVRRQQIEAGA